MHRVHLEVLGTFYEK